MMLGAIAVGRVLAAVALMAGAGVLLGAVIGAVARIFRKIGRAHV